jgi:hypothetical protein
MQTGTVEISWQGRACIASKDLCMPFSLQNWRMILITLQKAARQAEAPERTEVSGSPGPCVLETCHAHQCHGLNEHRFIRVAASCGDCWDMEQGVQNVHSLRTHSVASISRCSPMSTRQYQFTNMNWHRACNVYANFMETPLLCLLRDETTHVCPPRSAAQLLHERSVDLCVRPHCQ